jgi:hypothetical protein
MDSTQCSPSSGQQIAGNTSWRGYIQVRIRTTKVGQAESHWIYDPSYRYSYFDYVVGYNDVYYNNHEEIWKRIGGDDTGGGTGHGSTHYNRYMMSVPAYGLYYATLDYLDAHPGQQKVCTNDMALPFGGKFDTNRNWTSPHTAHDRGTAVDVAGSSPQCPDAYEVNVAQFVDACAGRGGAWSIPEGNHAHCNFVDPTSYPH